MNTEKRVNERIAKVALKNHEVDLNLVQGLLADVSNAEQALKALQNLAARKEYDFRKIEDMAKKVGIDLDPKIIAAGKFFRELERKLK